MGPQTPILARRGLRYIYRWLVCLLILVQPGFTPHPPRSAELTITQNGRFTALYGKFFASRDRIDMYSAVPEVSNEKSGKKELAPDDDDLLPQWKGEPYYYEAYALRNGIWVKELRRFSGDPSAFLDLGPCDPLDQLDLSSIHSEFKAPLPAGSKIKAVLEFGEGEGGYAAAVYSAIPEGALHHSLILAGYLRRGSGWERTVGREISDYGFFCGTRAMPTTLTKGKKAIDLLVYVDEPGGSSNYITIYSYLITIVSN